MNEKEYRCYMKEIRKQSNDQVDDHVARVLQYEQFLESKYRKDADEATKEELLAYFESFDVEKDELYLKHHYSIVNYYWCTFKQSLVGEMEKIYSRRTGKKRRIFELKKFKGVNKDHLRKLREIGIATIEDIHRYANTKENREELAFRVGIPADWLMKITKLSDLARIPGLKGTRAVLYYDAGVDTIEKIADWNAVKLRNHLIKFFESTGYQGAKPPTLKECSNHVKIAKNLPRIIKY